MRHGGYNPITWSAFVGISEYQCFQQSITTAIVFENLTASLRLGEHMLNSCETVEEFNSLLEKSRCISEYNVNSWRDNEFAKAKEQLASGEGLGRGFLEHFLGKRKHMSPNTIQAAWISARLRQESLKSSVLHVWHRTR